ncbi:MAG: hypothetical protein EOO60_11795 [Hymenobacter sp.]|nr:MAG: hypothetical protein EOO60_11795 [Hymenobacter sp.]
MCSEKNIETLDKRRKYDDALKAEALRLAAQSYSTQGWPSNQYITQRQSHLPVRQLCQTLRV